jgi:hypothetical protein
MENKMVNGVNTTPGKFHLWPPKSGDRHQKHRENTTFLQVCFFIIILGRLLAKPRNVKPDSNHLKERRAQAAGLSSPLSVAKLAANGEGCAQTVAGTGGQLE